MSFDPIIHQTGISASEISSILGIEGAYETAFDVWCHKLYGYPERDNDYLKYGQFKEKFLRMMFKEERKLEPVEVTWGEGKGGHILRHKDIPWHIASPDMYIPETNEPGELKNVGNWQNMQEWTETECPMKFYMQLQWQIGVDDSYESGWIGAELMGGRFKTYHFDRDQKTIDGIRKAAGRFWKLVQTQKRPITDLANPYYAPVFPDHKSNEDAIIPVVLQLHNCKKAMKEAEAWEENLKDQIKEVIGDHAGLLLPFGRIDYKAPKDRVETNWKAIAEELGATPDVIKKHTITKPSSRTFRMYLKEEQITNYLEGIDDKQLKISSETSDNTAAG